MRWHIDHLTGLHNRDAFARRLGDARSRRVTGSVALLDIDHFKRVNDRLGDHMGDDVLRVIARRLNESLPRSSVLARVGGDEFMAFLPAVDAHAAADLMRHCLDRVKEPLERPDGMAPLTMSGGLAAFDGQGIDELFKACDIAMVAAKCQGHDRVVVFDDRFQPLAQARRELASMVIELQQRNRALEDEVHIDALTELRNRRALDKVLDRVTGAPGSFGFDTAVAFIDIDHFGAYNHAYGDPAGDEALKAVARAISEATREGDLVYRKGGEEFVVILQGAAGDAALAAAERIRERVQRLRMPHRESKVAQVVTVTVGVASARRGRPVRDLMNAAAEQTMGAKVSQERNRVHRVVL
jgi:diguanylate cyclase (GGDEF)-like protein